MHDAAWILTDGKAGDEAQCLGVVERLGLAADLRRVAPRAPFTWAMPWGPIDPRERAGRPGSPIQPGPGGWPDLAVASGRRAVPYLRETKRREARLGRALLHGVPQGPADRFARRRPYLGAGA